MHTKEIPHPVPFLFRRRAQVGWVFGFFFRNRNNCSSSDAYIIYIYCGSRMKISTRKTLYGTPRSWAHLFCLCFGVPGADWQSLKPSPSNLSHMPDDEYPGWHTRSWIWVCHEADNVWTDRLTDRLTIGRTPRKY